MEGNKGLRALLTVNLRPITSYDEYDNPVETGTDIFRMKMTGVVAESRCFFSKGKGWVKSWVLTGTREFF